MDAIVAYLRSQANRAVGLELALNSHPRVLQLRLITLTSDGLTDELLPELIHAQPLRDAVDDSGLGGLWMHGHRLSRKGAAELLEFEAQHRHFELLTLQAGARSVSKVSAADTADTESGCRAHALPSRRSRFLRARGF